VWFIATETETATMTEIEGVISVIATTEGIGITTGVLTTIGDLTTGNLTIGASSMTGALVATTGGGTAIAGSTGTAAGGFTKTLALAESRKAECEVNRIPPFVFCMQQQRSRRWSLLK
jgi:hypothetical protein